MVPTVMSREQMKQVVPVKPCCAKAGANPYGDIVRTFPKPARLLKGGVVLINSMSAAVVHGVDES
jgi:hypothetical protein